MRGDITFCCQPCITHPPPHPTPPHQTDTEPTGAVWSLFKTAYAALANDNTALTEALAAAKAASNVSGRGGMLEEERDRGAKTKTAFAPRQSTEDMSSNPVRRVGSARQF